MATLYVALVLFYGWACFSANAEDSNNTCPTYYETCLDAYYKLKCKGGAKSGEYFITKPTVRKVYCDMEGTNCGGEGGWMRVAQLDMTFQGAECPSGLNQGSYGGKTLCGSQRKGCSSIRFNNYGVPYSEVCGFVTAYQDGSPDAFHGKNAKIDSTYIDGISITYGSRPRNHIWSLAAGVASGRSLHFDCPCNVGAPDDVPYFVGHDYYCESGNPTRFRRQEFFPDVLWDGRSCTLKEVPCCKDPWLPYFRKDLGELTTDAIELRLCHNEAGSDEDVPIESYEFFVR